MSRFTNTMVQELIEQATTNGVLNAELLAELVILEAAEVADDSDSPLPGLTIMQHFGFPE